MIYAVHVARMGDMRGAYRVLGWNLEGKRPLGIPRQGWYNNIKMNFNNFHGYTVHQ
jgi:hypothetical protein